MTSETPKLPSSFKKRNRTTRQFREQYACLPEQIQHLTRAGAVLFDKNPDLPSFRKHVLKDTKNGKHKAESVSISINMQYRAIFVVVEGVNVWYWIGTHADYDDFTGRT